MSEDYESSLVQELHQDLARRYQLHGSRIKSLWQSLDRNQREKVVKAGAADGILLKDSSDQTLDAYNFTPEWNLWDLTQSEPEYLLDVLRHRATRSLSHQYLNGMHGAPGDYEFIMERKCFKNLGHLDPFQDGFTIFNNEDLYGRSFEIQDPSKKEEVLSGLSGSIEAGLCVPQSTGELILRRQIGLLQALSILVEDILAEGSRREGTTLPKRPKKATHAALSTSLFEQRPAEISFEELLSQALDQRNCLDDYVMLCRTEPVFLTHVVNSWFYSRPELVPDEKGHIFQFVTTDKYISFAIFEVLQNVVGAVAIWDYIYQLLQELATKLSDRRCKAVILQELVNVCHFEHCRAQKLFKRFAQTGLASKYFNRITGTNDDDVRVLMTIQPDILTRTNPQIHYVLRLCQPNLDAPARLHGLKS